MNAIQKLRQLHQTITTSTNGFEIEDAWTLAKRLCSRYKTDPELQARAFDHKDKDALAQLIDQIENPDQPAPAPQEDIPERDLHDALKLFKKRLASTKLDQESKLGTHALASSGRVGVMSMEPPHDYPKRVWKELARRGLIRDDGQGFYSIPDAPAKS
jgi:hypothetical protein